jgi:hypothetical protein
MATPFLNGYSVKPASVDGLGKLHLQMELLPLLLTSSNARLMDILTTELQELARLLLTAQV